MKTLADPEMSGHKTTILGEAKYISPFPIQ